MHEKSPTRLIKIALLVAVGSAAVSGCGERARAQVVSADDCYTGPVGNISVWQGVRDILRDNGFNRLEELDGANSTSGDLHNALVAQHEADGHHYSALPEDIIDVCVMGNTVTAGTRIDAFGK